jgi:hypothetical protein
MTGRSAFVWYLHGPNLLILALICLLILRLALSVVAGGSGVGRLVAAVTRPVTAVVGFITPRIVPPSGVVALSIGWLIAVRAALVMAALANGVQL